VVRNQEVRLKPTEFDLLGLYGKAHITHRALLAAVWGPNSVEQPYVFIGQFRKKLELTKMLLAIS
jgi:DNA-binding response OmpR family regulator